MYDISFGISPFLNILDVIFSFNCLAFQMPNAVSIIVLKLIKIISGFIGAKNSIITFNMDVKYVFILPYPFQEPHRMLIQDIFHSMPLNKASHHQRMYVHQLDQDKPHISLNFQHLRLITYQRYI